MELGGDISLLYRRLRASPIIFSEFEAWVDPRNVRKFKMAKHPGGGYYPKGKSTVVSILTNPIYIGYRTVEGVVRRNRAGEKIREFDEPLIEPELFYFAFYRLAKTDLDGNPIEGKRPRRFFHQDSKGEFGLLKFRVTSNQGEVHTHVKGAPAGEMLPGTGSYRIQTLEQQPSLYHVITHASLPCEELDTIIVTRLMEHVQHMSHLAEDIAEYEMQAEKQRAERRSKIKQISAAIDEIAKTQSGLTRKLGAYEAEIAEAQEQGDTEKIEMKRRLKELAENELVTLEKERRKLIAAKAGLEAGAESDFDSLERELQQLATQWPKYSFEKRRALMNFIVREVVIDMMSTHWLRIQVSWLHEEWGQEEMYYYRRRGECKDWTEEEIAVVREHYANTPKFELLALLPHRSWHGIRSIGEKRLKIARRKGHLTDSENLMPGLDVCDSYSDMEFLQSKGMLPGARSTNWEQLS
jgi:hypothetical protein